MSFIKKGLKKIWEFVKDNWKTIVVVAAVAFTAGIATIGVAGFQASVAANGFLHTVGSTMWAGVTATAGSMGIGSGASGAAVNAAAAAGAIPSAGVGLGAAMGAGGGYGLGAAGKAAAATAAQNAAVAANATPGMGVLSSLQGAPASVPAVTNPVTGQAVAPELLTTSAKGVATDAGASLVSGEAAKEGMSMGKALLYSQALQTGGAMLQGYAEGKAMEEAVNANKPLAAWGVATEERGGRTDPVENYLFQGAVMQPLAGDTADATTAANQLTQAQANAPLMNIARPMAASQPGMATPGLDPRRGVSYTPQQMLGVGLSGQSPLMAQDPRSRSMLNQPNFLIGALDDWRLRG